MNKKQILLYGISLAILAGCIVYLLLPIKLKLSYVLDDARLAEEKPIWVQGFWLIKYTEWVDGYWVCPQCDSNLTEIVIFTEVDGGMSVLYCNPEDIFWILYGWGPMKVKFYGPYQGSLWRLINTLNVVALSSVLFSGIALLSPFIHRALTNRRK